MDHSEGTPPGDTDVARAALQLKAIADTTQEVFVLLDSEGRVEYINAALERVLGYAPRAILGQPLHATLAPPEHMDAIRAGYARFQHTGEGPVVGKVLELEAMHAAGHRVPVELSVSALWMDGEWHAVGVIRDISPRRQAERELATHREQLRARESLEATVFNATRDGILVTDAGERIEAVNRAFSEITGYSEDEVRGRTPRLLQSGRQTPAFYREMHAELARSGEWTGEFLNRRRDGSVYPQWTRINAVYDHAGHVERYVAVFSDLSEVKAWQARIERLTHQDPVTDLANRLLFRSRLEHALQKRDGGHEGAAVVHLGLDGFKQVNESLGPAAGDDLLRVMGARLQALALPGETVARVAGDEFAFLVEGEERASLLAQAVLQQVAQNTLVNKESLYVTASVGVACFPRDARDMDTLLRNADTALHQAKAAGGNTWRAYSQELTEVATDRLRLTARLREAITAEEFELHYQPQVSLSDGRVIGVEALVRWRHPETGLIAPDRFIPVAEDSGLIVALGEWVLHSACQQAREWLDNGVLFGHVGVNVSAGQIRRQAVAPQVSAALEASGLPPERLEVEITESLAMDRRGNAPGFLAAMNEKGVRLAIDDFGTGYSSLAYLRDLPFDTLKIDRAFMQGLPGSQTDAAIVEAICTLGRHLGLQVLAEGVETAAQAELLRELGCLAAQGFLFARPLPAGELPEALERINCAADGGQTDGDGPGRNHAPA